MIGKSERHEAHLCCNTLAPWTAAGSPRRQAAAIQQFEAIAWFGLARVNMVSTCSEGAGHQGWLYVFVCECVCVFLCPAQPLAAHQL